MPLEQRESTGARKNNNVNIHGWEICLQDEGKIKGRLLGEGRQNIGSGCYYWK